jgi:hypothetical protein
LSYVISFQHMAALANLVFLRLPLYLLYVTHSNPVLLLMTHRYPKKHRVMVGFMATFLREEG